MTNIYTIEEVITPLRKGISLVILALMFCGTTVFAADSTWTNVAGGDIETVGNWVGGVPGDADRPIFNRNADYTVTLQNDKTNATPLFSGSNSPNVTIGVNSTKTWTWTGNSSLIGNSTAQTNSVTLTTGTLAVAVLQVGYSPDSDGTLNIAGGSLQLSGRLAVGTQPGSTGAVNITAGELQIPSDWTGIGMDGDGSMDISGGTNNFYYGWIGYANGIRGDMYISGGSNVYSSYLGVGRQGVGNLTVSGGYLEITNGPLYAGWENAGVGTINLDGGTNRFRHAYIADQAGSMGTVNVSGGTNTFSHYLGLGMNAGATGSLVITGGDLVQLSEGVTIGNNGIGEVTISNGTFDISYGYAGLNAGATGTLNIAGGKFSNTNNNFSIGYGGNGYLYQSSGTSYWKEVNIGHIASGTGLCVVSGGELHVTNSGVFRIGTLGKAQMTVSGGTHFLRQLEIGSESGSWGRLNMQGGTINLDPINDVFTIGRTGTGTLYMTGGTIQQPTYASGWTRMGQLNDTSGRVDLVGGDITLNELWMADAARSTGVLNIAGGDLTLKGYIACPRTGRSEVNVSAGSLMSEGVTIMGQVASSDGFMTISGGTVTSTGGFYVANAADTKCDLTISGGSITCPGGMLVAAGSSSTGTVTVIGTNATVNFLYYLHYVTGGSEATTVFRMSAGGVSPIVLNNDCNLQGGTLTVGMKGYMDTVTTNVIPLIDTSAFSGTSEFATTNSSIFDVYKVGTTQLVARAKSTSKAGDSAVANNNYQRLTAATNAGWIAINTSGLSSTFTAYVRVDTNGASYTAADLATAMTAAGHTASASKKSGDDWIAVTLSTPLNATPSFAIDLTDYDSNIEVDVIAINKIPDLYTSVFTIR